MQAGDIVGEMALITGEPRNAHVDAETDMYLWCLEKTQFDKISKTYPELRSFLTDLIANWF
jgi:CRP-like cAMP-binding protein